MSNPSIGARLGTAALATSAFLAGLAAPSHALEFTKSGTTLTLSGRIVDGDELRFKEMLDDPGAPTIATVRLDSGGGKIAPAGEISRLIRARRLTTLIDGARAKCASACTVIFAGGTQRLYINADMLSEGPMSKSNFVGLGFHEGNSPLALAANHYSGQATAKMVDYYYEMGIPSAKNLASKAPPEQYYRISGRTALATGIATGTR